MSRWQDHLPIAPILLPMLAGIAAILIGDRSRAATRAVGLASCLGLVALSAALLAMADAPLVRVYRLGDWPAAFGIVLALDRLAALMLALAAALGLAAFVFSLARWQRAGSHVHPFFQFQLMGLNGAFLTGDLFNRFVFFEVMLAASYGLALHGSGIARVRAGLHYIVVNLVASLLFLVGVSVVYGIAGTLNMADLAARMPRIAVVEIGPVGLLLLLCLALTVAAGPAMDYMQAAAAALHAPQGCLRGVMAGAGGG